jgi:hypothetical protein
LNLPQSINEHVVEHFVEYNAYDDKYVEDLTSLVLYYQLYKRISNEI